MVNVNKMYKTQEEGIVSVKNEKGELLAIIYKDGANHPIIYTTTVANVDEIVTLVSNSPLNVDLSQKLSIR